MPTAKTTTATPAATPVTIKVKKLDPAAHLPAKATKDSACFDLYTLEQVHVRNLNADAQATKVRTGIALEIPKGYHVEVFLRSSIGLNTKIRLANQTGIVDSDYTGELYILVENPSRQPITIPAGTRIAQMMLVRDIPTTIKEVKTIKQGAHKGFGSTGR